MLACADAKLWQRGRALMGSTPERTHSQSGELVEGGEATSTNANTCAYVECVQACACLPCGSSTVPHCCEAPAKYTLIDTVGCIKDAHLRSATCMLWVRVSGAHV